MVAPAFVCEDLGADRALARVMIVDDNPAIHDDFRKILVAQEHSQRLAQLEDALFGTQTPAPRLPRFELVSAHQGWEGVELARQAQSEGRPFAVAFVDVRMPPGMDGIAATKAIWTEDPDVQVVICTAHADYSWAEMAHELENGHFVILKKPFEEIEVQQLASMLCLKWSITQQQREMVKNLEGMVDERTTELERTNHRLRSELVRGERLQREIQRKSRLEALGRLASGIGHEINNPLAYVITNLQYCAESLRHLVGPAPSRESDEIQTALEEAIAGAARIKNIVKSLRVFGQGAPKREPVDIRDCIAFSLRLVGNEIRHRAQLRINLGEGSQVLADRGQLEQVFVNLLTNAAHAIPGGNAEENEIRITSRQIDGSVQIKVRDTGTGMPAEVVDKVFDPFFTTKSPGSGMGLGLSICHGIAAGLGGDIQIAESNESGTTVCVTLPAANRTLVAVPADEGDNGSDHEVPADLRVLIIDDDPAVARALTRVLGRHDFTLIDNGKRAIDLLARANHFDVVFCDLMMPNTSGMEVYRAVRQMTPGRERDLIFITGGAFTPEAESFLATVPNVVLHKPFERETVIEALTRQLGRRPA